ncbi:MAG: hypothetical protein MUQ00_00320 [Candidatus Aminicenantes bacterium]|nr:hypothetical protein [Candidatus Aminicenantes bacterium]
MLHNNFRRYNNIVQGYWSLTAREIEIIGRSPGGDKFVNLLNRLIHAHAFASGITDSNIETNLATTIPDGGVDTKVNIAIPSDSTGWFKEKTIWQFKASEYSSLNKTKLTSEINKTFAKRCIQQGYGYRLCICDNLPPSKSTEWVEILNGEAKRINPNAVPVAVISSDNIENWIDKYPAIVIYFRQSGFGGDFLYLEAWRVSIIHDTAKYVQPDKWQVYRGQFLNHINFRTTSGSAIITLQGAAGVGKTRLVYEVLKEIEGVKNLLVYTSDEDKAVEMAYHFANNPTCHAILVADECTIQKRIKLENLLKGHQSRIKTIAIDNSGQRPPSGIPELWLEPVSSEKLEEILTINFSEISIERIRAYSDLAKGFPQFAIWLCKSDAQIQKNGTLESAFIDINNTLEGRLAESDLQVLEALALIKTVGYKGETSGELESLSQLVRMDAIVLQQTAPRLHDNPGFVGKAGRYFYVTPDIVAQVAFKRAWKRWAQDDPEHFLEKMPSTLLEKFLVRVSESAPSSIREKVAFFFLEWANKIKPTDLIDIKITNKIVILISVHPNIFLPVLHRIIKSASKQTLYEVSGDSTSLGWGPRRYLVWLMERLAAFPEYFDNSEEILLALALSENEPGIANNASAIWKQLFRIFLSGTAVPFNNRLKRLRSYVYSSDVQISDLALSALEDTLKINTSRILGPAVVAGRIPPPDWLPKTNRETRLAWNEVIELLLELITNKEFPLSEKAINAGIAHMRQLLNMGYAEQLKKSINKLILSDLQRARIISEIENFLHFDILEAEDNKRFEPEYVEVIRNWQYDLQPCDLHGRLVAKLGVSPWHHVIIKDREKWVREIGDLAKLLIMDPSIFSKELDWLFSKDAISAGVLGEEIAKRDKDITLFDVICKSVLGRPNVSLVRGYLFGIMKQTDAHDKRINHFLDKVQDKYAEAAVELASASERRLRKFDRLIRLVDQKKLPLHYIRILGFGYDALSNNQVKEVLKRLLGRIEDENICRIALEFIFSVTHSSPSKILISENELTKIAWAILESTVGVGSLEEHYWAEALSAIAESDPKQAARLAVLRMVEQGLLGKKLNEVIIWLAKECPIEITNALVEVALDKQKGWHFFVGNFRALVDILPISMVVSQIKLSGVELALRLARHLPQPFIDDHGNPSVPELTAFVLQEYQDDDRVFSEFLAGAHSFQMYSGDIAAQREKEAREAFKFLDHPIKRISEWARLESKRGLREAEMWRQIDEETIIE